MKLAAALLVGLAFLGPLDGVDRAARDWVQGIRGPALEGPMRFATDIGKPVIVLGGLALIAVLDRPQGLLTARDALLALAPTNLAVEGLKRWTDRARPDGEHKRSNAAFPSSHAANAFALALVLSRRWRRAAPIWIAIAVAVAFSRMYLDRHWFTDVVAGTLIGAGFALAVAQWRARWERRGKPAPGRT